MGILKKDIRKDGLSADSLSFAVSDSFSPDLQNPYFTLQQRFCFVIINVSSFETYNFDFYWRRQQRESMEFIKRNCYHRSEGGRLDWRVRG